MMSFNFSPMLGQQNRNRPYFSLIGAFIVIFGSRIAFEKLGINNTLGLVLIFGSLVLSSVNLPAGTMKTAAHQETHSMWYFDRFANTEVHFQKFQTKIFFNVGGAVIPSFIALGLLIDKPVLIVPSIIATISMTLITYRLSHIIPGRGIGIPLLLLPVLGLANGLIITGLMQFNGTTINIGTLAIIVYTATTLGTILGADILNLLNIRYLRAPFLSIGGAGTFDGIFLVGVLAILVLVPF